MNNDDIDRNYTEICSSQTIFSNEKGFFGDLFENVRQACNEKWIEKTFNSTIDDSSKLKLLFNESPACDILLGTLEHVQPIYRRKDCIFSSTRRMDGEKLMKLKDYQNALILMTQAVLRAPPKDADIRMDAGLSLAYAFWSRSAVLLELKNGQNAIIDMQCAIENGLEKVKEDFEYYKRLTIANALIGDKCKVQICMNLSKRFSSSTEEFKLLEEEVKRIKPNRSEKVKQKVPAVIGGEHKTLKSASSKIDLCQSEEGGNYVVAKESLNTGDTIIVEKPLAACLRPEYFGSHCLNCLTRIKIAYECPDCSNVAFCSPNCKELACDTYHKFECKFLDLLVGSGMSILCFIALRMITKYDDVRAAIENGRKVVKELCGHSNKREGKDYLQRTVMSAFLLRVLQKADYFGRRTSQSPYPNSDKEFEIGEILVGLLQVLQFNAHEIYESVKKEDYKFSRDKKLLYVGVAVYNSAAYFNHDCYPGVTRYFIGTEIVLRATHPLKPGEVVGENYGPIFIRQTLRERQRNLRSRYWFFCECQSCKENWPVLEKLDNRARLRCPTKGCDKIHSYPIDENTKVKCTKCNRSYNLKTQIDTLNECEELYRKGAELMEKEESAEAAKLFIQGINLFYTVAVPPHRDTHIAQETLRYCFADVGDID